MDGAEFDALVEDIKAHGLQQKLVMYQGKILDGRNRWRACEALGIKPKWVDYEGDDPLGHVLSLNLHRRHLDASQRAMVAARMATLKLGANQHTKEGAQICAPSQDEAAEKMTVSRRGVQSARAVVEHGTPALSAAVDRREVAVSVAGKIATAPKRVQREALKNHCKNAPAIAKRIDEEKKAAEPAQPEIIVPPLPAIRTLGLDVPADVMAAAEKEQALVDKMDRLLSELKRTYTEYEAARGDRKGLKTGQHHTSALRDSLQAMNTIRGQRPASVCPYCKLLPEIRKTCASCRTAGFVGEFDLERAAKELLIEGDEAGVWVNGKWRTMISLRGEDF
jgi:hypothetical protein